MTTRFHGYQRSCSVNFTVQLHASTSMSLLDTVLASSLLNWSRLSDYTLYKSTMDVLYSLVPGPPRPAFSDKSWAWRSGKEASIVAIACKNL